MRIQPLNPAVSGKPLDCEWLQYFVHFYFSNNYGLVKSPKKPIVTKRIALQC